VRSATKTELDSVLSIRLAQMEPEREAANVNISLFSRCHARVGEPYMHLYPPRDLEKRAWEMR
jgi:hypothetical protein